MWVFCKAKLVPSDHTVMVLPAGIVMPAPAAVVAQLAVISVPQIDPGAPVANPAIGATGDDNAAPVAFDPLASEAAVVAATETATQAVAVVSTVAAAAGAAAAAAAAAGAAAFFGAAVFFGAVAICFFLAFGCR